MERTTGRKQLHASFPALTLLALGLLHARDAWGNHCVDAGASDPSMVRIWVTVASAKGSASIDSDNFLFDNEADLLTQVSVNDAPFMAGAYVFGDDTPHWRKSICNDDESDCTNFEAEVPRDLRVVPIRIRLKDKDEPDPDNRIDLDPGGGCNQDLGVDDPDCTLELFFDLCCYSFTGEGISADSGCDCDGAVCSCKGGVDHKLGPGDHDEHAYVNVNVRTADELTVCTEADVAITGVDFVQIVDHPGLAVGGRGSILRVRMASTFDGSVDTSVIARIGDAIGPDDAEERAVTLDSCAARWENFFVDDPSVVVFSSAHFGAQIDPLGILPFTDPCARVNDGDCSADGDPCDGELAIHPTRDLSVVYQRMFYPIDCLADDVEGPCFNLLPGDALAEAIDANERIRGFFPTPELLDCPEPFDNCLDPIRWPMATPIPDVVLGPRSEIIALSEAAALLGLDRVVGLVPEHWIDGHLYFLIPEGTGGVANGKIDPHFVLAERIEGQEGYVPPHELGHTFGLSDEPCSISDLNIFELWKCEDEYNTDVFPDRPAGGYQGKGFDVPNGAEAAGTCFMDRDPDAWISNNDFESLVGKMLPGVDPRVLVVTGYVTNTGGGEIFTAVGIDEGIPDRSGPTASPFSLAVRDVDGLTLGQYGIYTDMKGDDRFEAGEPDPPPVLRGDLDGNGIPDRLPVSHPAARDENGNGIPDATERAEFALRIPWPLRTRRVDLLGPTGNLVDTVLLEEAAPEIVLLEPVGDVRLDPVVDPDSLLVPVRWRIGGAGEAAALSVQDVAIGSSYDGGQTWFPRAAQVQGDAFVIDARDITTPLTMRLKVLALDNGPAGIDTVAGDIDQDRCPDPIDPHPTSPDTADRDGDGIPDVCDRCLNVINRLQTDRDQDGYGDACDADYDNDGLVTETDRTGGFEPCVGAGVITNPQCFDRDFNHDGAVTAADRPGFDQELARGRPGPSGLVPSSPVAVGSAQVLGCGASGMALARLDGTASTDFDSPPGTNDDILLFEWFESFGTPSQIFLGSGEVQDVPLAAGTHTVTLRVTDFFGLAAVGPLVVTIGDADQDSVVDVCDNCPQAPNSAQQDTDQDGQGDACDCMPQDPGAWAVPAEVTGLRSNRATGGPDLVALSWGSLAGQAGPGLLHDVITGTLSSLRASQDFSSFTCLATDEPGTSIVKMQPQLAPPLPNGYWYLVRAQNACGTGTWGDGTPTPDPRDALDQGAQCTPPAPVLAIGKTDAPDPVATGSNLTYTLTYANTGTANATGVMIQDMVPASTTFVSATGGGILAGGVVTWNLGTLAPGPPGAVQMVVRVAHPLTSGAPITNSSYGIDSAETGFVGGAPVATSVLDLPILAIDLDPSTPTVIDSTRVLTGQVSTLDVGIIVDARGSSGIGDVVKVPFGVINAFNPGGAAVTSITPIAITDILPPSAPPNNATFTPLGGEFQYGAALQERGTPPGGTFFGGPVQYARFRISFGSLPPGSSVRVFIGDRGPGTGAIRNGSGVDISGDFSADGTPVLGSPGSDEGAAARMSYRDGLLTLAGP